MYNNEAQRHGAAESQWPACDDGHTHKVALFGVMVASMARTTKFMDIYLEDCSAI
jgi:hypothetical protein